MIIEMFTATDKETKRDTRVVLTYRNNMAQKGYYFDNLTIAGLKIRQIEMREGKTDIHLYCDQ